MPGVPVRRSCISGIIVDARINMSSSVIDFSIWLGFYLFYCSCVVVEKSGVIGAGNQVRCSHWLSASTFSNLESVVDTKKIQITPYTFSASCSHFLTRAPEHPTPDTRHPTLASKLHNSSNSHNRNYGRSLQEHYFTSSLCQAVGGCRLFQQEESEQKDKAQYHVCAGNLKGDRHGDLSRRLHN
jgi:hypothetical protein